MSCTPPGAAGTVLSAAVTRNGAPTGNQASQAVAANKPGNLLLVSLLALAEKDAVGVAVSAEGPTSLSANLTAFQGYRL